MTIDSLQRINSVASSKARELGSSGNPSASATAMLLSHLAYSTASKREQLNHALNSIITESKTALAESLAGKDLPQAIASNITPSASKIAELALTIQANEDTITSLCEIVGINPKA